MLELFAVMAIVGLFGALPIPLAAIMLAGEI